MVSPLNYENDVDDDDDDDDDDEKPDSRVAKTHLTNPPIQDDNQLLLPKLITIVIMRILLIMTVMTVDDHRDYEDPIDYGNDD